MQSPGHASIDEAGPGAGRSSSRRDIDVCRFGAALSPLAVIMPAAPSMSRRRRSEDERLERLCAMSDDGGGEGLVQRCAKEALQMIRALTLPCAVTVLMAACGGGGGGGGAGGTAPKTGVTPSTLAVLIADGDATSEAIAKAYQQARGIPEANMIRVSMATGSDTIDADSFIALRQTLQARLGDNIQAMLVTWSRPSRVVGSCSMGLTAALTLGFDAALCGRCVAPRRSAYYDSSSTRPWTDLKLRPSMMLGVSTLDDAKALIARGVAADGSRTAAGAATAQTWLMRTSDIARSVRWPDFLAASQLTAQGLGMHYVDNSSGAGSDFISGQKDVMIYLTGLDRVPGIATNNYLPGAVADHLTSWGGQLPDASGQMPITDWVAAGVTASYGTVEEPCNFAEKFPSATVLIVHYHDGDTLIEAYWKSVQSPGQGLFIGEPLARPWAN
jgi:uncharacterized protein (TIGR03790 family)